MSTGSQGLLVFGPRPEMYYMQFRAEKSYAAQEVLFFCFPGHHPAGLTQMTSEVSTKKLSPQRFS